MNPLLVFLLAICLILLPNLGGLLISLLAVRPNLDTWFESLRAPELRPPNWLFGIAWTVLYTAIGLASFAVWWRAERTGYKTVSRHEVLVALLVYTVQLALNWAWSPVFFASHQLLAALVVILLLDAVALLNAVLFVRISWLAGALYVPYLLWLAFATYLNYAYWVLNPTEG